MNEHLRETLENSEVILVTGKRGAGKTALLCTILENSSKKDTFITGISQEYWHLLPDTITPLPLDAQTLEHLPENATIALDESALFFYSRDYSKQLNKLVSKLVTEARHKKELLVFATHSLRKIDIGIAIDADAIIFKEPSLLHSKFERKEILRLVQEAKRAFDKLLPTERVKHAYLVSQDYEGMLEVELPSFWTEELSHAVASVPKVYNDRSIYRIGGTEMGRKVKEKKVEEVEEIVEEVTTTKKLPVVSGTATERINAMIRDGMQIVPNYYASRGVSIIEIVCPEELADDIEAGIYEYKSDPEAPDVMVQEPSFEETRPDFADGMVAFQLCLDDPHNLLSSGYSIKSMLKELKEKPILITISTTIREKLIT